MERWLEMCKHTVNGGLDRVMLVGSKSDLAQQRAITKDAFQAFGKDNKVACFEVSATNPASVAAVFQHIVDAELRTSGSKY